MTLQPLRPMRHDPPSARPAGETPTPARPAAARPQSQSDGDSTEAEPRGAEVPVSARALTSARAMAQTEAAPSPTTPDAEAATVEVDGSSWVVRVIGRTIGAGVARVQMLLLGFWPEGDAQGDPKRECLVVGGTLDALSQGDLERSFERSRTPIARPDPGRDGPGRREGRAGATHRRGR